MPTTAGILPLYVEPTFHRVGRYCFEHGFTHALHSAAKHLVRLREENRMRLLSPIQLDGTNSYFEFKMLAVGLMVSAAFFVAELAVANHWLSQLVARIRWIGLAFHR